VATNFFLAPGAVGPITVNSIEGRIAFPNMFYLEVITFILGTYLKTEL